MTFFSTLFGDSKMAGALAFVVGLLVLALLAFLAYRMVAGRGLRSAPGNRSRQPRLGIVDAFDLDRQRQLVLVRRDNVEHLIMIGGPNDLLIEQAIVRGLPMSNGETRREPGVAAASPGTPNNGGTTERTAPRMPTYEGAREPEREPEREALRQPPREAPESGFGSLPPPSRGPSADVASAAPPLPMPPPRPPFAVTPPAEPPAPQPPMRPLPPPRPIPTLPPRPAPATPGLRPPPPPSRGPAASPPPPRPPMPPQPAPPGPAAPPTEPSAPPPQRPSVDIDSLEEEMAKLLGRPPSDAGKT
ncbi:MAG: hypothetical protein JWM36_2613 [Hyphomicrobiales bacterium]|nr:hypothetical protein [Hyphomicrobiales bacterium]